MTDEPIWVCCARPARMADPRTCYHVNRGGTYCEECGATKHAGDLRREKGDLDPLPDDARFPVPPVCTALWDDVSWALWFIKNAEGTP